MLPHFCFLISPPVSTPNSYFGVLTPCRKLQKLYQYSQTPEFSKSTPNSQASNSQTEQTTLNLINNEVQLLHTYKLVTKIHQRRFPNASTCALKRELKRKAKPSIRYFTIQLDRIVSTRQATARSAMLLPPSNLHW